MNLEVVLIRYLGLSVLHEKRPGRQSKMDNTPHI